MVEKALADFPDNGSAIRSRFAPFLKIEQDAARHLEGVNSQFDRYTGNGKADFAVFADSCSALGLSAATIDKLAGDVQKDFQQLYQSYTKVLKDMKINYHVTVKRESWNENSDFYDPRFFTYHREIPADVYEQVTADNVDTIAEITAGFTGSRLKNRIGDVWNRLSIDPTENWPGRSHNAATFWIDDSNETFFHNYILEQNGETSETGWEQVDERVYDVNLEYLAWPFLRSPTGCLKRTGSPRPPRPVWRMWAIPSTANGARMIPGTGSGPGMANTRFFPTFSFSRPIITGTALGRGGAATIGIKNPILETPPAERDSSAPPAQL